MRIRFPDCVWQMHLKLCCIWIFPSTVSAFYIFLSVLDRLAFEVYVFRIPYISGKYLHLKGVWLRSYIHIIVPHNCAQWFCFSRYTRFIEENIDLHINCLCALLRTMCIYSPHILYCIARILSSEVICAKLCAVYTPTIEREIKKQLKLFLCKMRLC